MIEKTTHTIITGNATNLSKVDDGTVALVVTSPPYPMIEMWDDSFASQSKDVASALKEGNADLAFELMHQTLDGVWSECYRVLCDGGIACINIGDATRTIDARFQLFSNHARIIASMISVGFSGLPGVVWRKQTNAPNKFMGSGMLPPGAYVTLEHEFILVFRKGNKREFASMEKAQRRESAYFWEERNQWFSDLWELKGTTQSIARNGARDRSGAYPFDIPYRLINMFSTKGDIVLDPFMGIGTTALAAAASGRNSIGYELECDLEPIVRETMLSKKSLTLVNDVIRRRILNHIDFIEERRKLRGEQSVKHTNEWFGFPVMTRQERELTLPFVCSMSEEMHGQYNASYTQGALLDYQGEDSLFSAVQA